MNNENNLKNLRLDCLNFQVENKKTKWNENEDNFIIFDKMQNFICSYFNNVKYKFNSLQYLSLKKLNESEIISTSEVLKDFLIDNSKNLKIKLKIGKNANIKIEYVSNPHKPGMDGVGGIFTITIKATTAGEGKLLLAYRRPWAPADNDMKFTLTIHIN